MHHFLLVAAYLLNSYEIYIIYRYIVVFERNILGYVISNPANSGLVSAMELCFSNEAF